MSMADTKQEIAPKRENPVAIVRDQLGAMQDQFDAALPEHIPVARFVRVVMTAVQNSPELLECDRRSFFNACMKAAQDGLIPDGREGAIVVRFDPKAVSKKSANWQVMIAGIRKKARNSGEIATWDVEEVRENDEFDFEMGDNPYIHHKPALSNRGKLIACYSVCTLKSGEKTRLVMGIDDILAIRDQYSDGWKAYKAGRIKSTPWLTSEGEMSKKTVARRHSKTIPMSTDLEALIRRDDDPLPSHQVERLEPPKDRTLKGRLDALAGVEPEKSAEPSHDPDIGEIIDNERDSPAGDLPRQQDEAAAHARADVETGAGGPFSGGDPAPDPRSRAPNEQEAHMDAYQYGTIPASGGQPSDVSRDDAGDGRGAGGQIERSGNAPARGRENEGRSSHNGDPGSSEGAAPRQGPQTGVGASPTPTASTPATVAETAFLADVIARGNAAAAEGPAAILNFLGDLPRATKAMLPDGQILAWNRTADRRAASRDKGRSAAQP